MSSELPKTVWILFPAPGQMSAAQHSPGNVSLSCLPLGLWYSQDRDAVTPGAGHPPMEAGRGVNELDPIGHTSSPHPTRVCGSQSRL